MNIVAAQRAKYSLVAALAVIGLAALPGIAHAGAVELSDGDGTLQFSATGLPAQSGSVDTINLTTSDLGSSTFTVNPGPDQVSLSFYNGAKVVQGSLTDFYAAPVTGGTPSNPVSLTTPYLSTEDGTIILGFTQQQSYFGLLWGSVGAGDELAFYNTAVSSTTPVASLFGSELIADANVNTSNGSQGFDGSQYVLINLGPGLTFNTVALEQTVSPSFESADFEYSSQNQSIPEPASIAVFGAGLFAFGFLRRKQILGMLNGGAGLV